MYFSALGFHLWHFDSLSEEFLDNASAMNRTWDVDYQKRFPVSQTNSMYQVACFGRGSTQIVDLERLPVDWENISLSQFSTAIRFYLLKNSLESFIQFVLSCKTPPRISWTLLNCLISWMCLIRVFRSVLSLRANSSSNLTCSLRDSSYPKWASSNSNRWEWACRWSSSMQASRESTLQSCFMISDFASASMWSLWPSKIDFVVSHCLLMLLENNNALVSPYLSGPEMN